MKTTNIAKIRQLLNKAREVRRSGMIFNDKYTITSGLTEICGYVKQALALLPCETCGGTGKVKGEPCPDCQS